MPVTLEDLFTESSDSEVESVMLDALRGEDFPVDSWHDTSVPIGLVKATRAGYVDQSKRRVEIAKGSTIRAEGDWLTLWARERYDEERKPAVALLGTRTIINESGSTYARGAGEIVIVSESDLDLVYRNVDAVSIPDGTSAPVMFAAERPGSIYNVRAADVSKLATPAPAVRIAPTVLSTWIVRAGVDEESDASLRTRCKTKWGALSTTGPVDGYVYRALSSDPGITKCRVQEDPFADMTIGEPAVTVWVAGPVGPPDPSARTAADIAVQKNKPLGVLVSVQGASAKPIELRGEVRIKTGYRTPGEALARASIRSYIAGLDIGEPVPVSKIVELIMDVRGVDNCTLVDGTDTPLKTGDFIGGLPAANEVATLLDALLFVSI